MAEDQQKRLQELSDEYQKVQDGKLGVSIDVSHLPPSLVGMHFSKHLESNNPHDTGSVL